jgi:hypothetical protein
MQEDDMHEELSTELAELGYSATHKKRTSADKSEWGRPPREKSAH